MKTPPTAKTNKKAFWLRWPFLVTVIPLSLFILCLLAVAVNEKRALERTQAEVARIRSNGQPIDDASMTQWFLVNTSQAGTAAWGELLRLVTAGPAGHGNDDQLPYVGTGPIPAELKPGGEWAAEQDVAEYLRWMRPTLQRIDAAAEYPAPVWQPLQFRGFMTLLEELQNSRSLIRLLQLDVEHALYQGDTQRALRGLGSMQAVAAAFDWEICMVADLVQIALRQVHQSMIRRSLAADLWSEQQLDVLHEQLRAPRDVPERWRRVIAGERALMISAIDSPQFWQDGNGFTPDVRYLMSVPTQREALLLAYRDFEDVGTGGLDGLTERARQAQLAWTIGADPRPSLFSSLSQGYLPLLPAVEGFARAIELEENSRRLTLTAVAIKRYQLRSGDWPEQLPQLEQVSLSAADWNTVSGGRFGYELQDEGPFLWSYDLAQETRVPAVRPEVSEQDNRSSRLWVKIR